MRRGMLGAAGAMAVLASLIGSTSIGVAGVDTRARPADDPDDRFEQIDGPMGAFVVRPEGFELDASRTTIAVGPLLDAVDGSRAMQVLTDLAFPRTAQGPEQARQDARDLVTGEFEDAGYDPQLQPVDLNGTDSPNVWVELPGTECPARTIVIGAHYDSEHPEGPGADDNASGVAGTLELARALRDHPMPVTVRFASWSYEEEGLVGAFAMAKAMKAEGRDLVGAISLEMIGFTKPDIDPLTGLPSTYLGMVADPTSATLARTFAAAAYTYTPEFAAFGAVIDPNELPDILRSDHAAFLGSGYRALIVTDTANFRNPNYHQVTDTPDTIDPAFLEGSTRAALAGLVTLASSDQNGDGRADACTDPLSEPAPTTSTTAPGATVPAPPGDASEGESTYTG